MSEHGLLQATPAAALVVDCSTIAPDTSRKVAKAAQERGIHFIDAPVSGGTAGAAGATLSFMVGGEAAHLERARPLLEKMGKNIFQAGPVGAGGVAKICNNMLLAIHMAGTAEALALGVANGLDPKVLSDIMGKSSGRNWSLEVYNPWPGVQDNVPAARDYAGALARHSCSRIWGWRRKPRWPRPARFHWGSWPAISTRYIVRRRRPRIFPASFSSIESPQRTSRCWRLAG